LPFFLCYVQHRPPGAPFAFFFFWASQVDQVLSIRSIRSSDRSVKKPRKKFPQSYIAVLPASPGLLQGRRRRRLACMVRSLVDTTFLHARWGWSYGPG
jgi:hypothetical protein